MSSKAVLALVLLAGCPQSGQSGECEVNAECSPDVCGRDHVCTDASNVREVTVTWTVDGNEASAASCGTTTSFTLTFLGDDFGDELGFEPVPCANGQFFIDRLPKRFHSVELGFASPRIAIGPDGTAHGDFNP